MTQSIYETQSYPQDQFPSFTEAVVQVSGNAAEVSEPLKWGSILLSVLALAFLPPVLGGAAAFMALKRYARPTRRPATPCYASPLAAPLPAWSSAAPWPWPSDFAVTTKGGPGVPGSPFVRQFGARR
jgi:hypothetical protein